jgi:hypothetical protein
MGRSISIARDVDGASCSWGELSMGASCPWGRAVHGGELSMGQDVIGRVAMRQVVRESFSYS